MTDSDRMRRTPLHDAALDGDLEAMKTALATGADLDAQDANGQAPLHLAAQQGQVRAVRLLLGRGAAVDLEDRWGNQPLWTAVFRSRGDGQIIAMLLAAGADPHHRNHAGRSALQLAQTIANYPVAQFFSEG